MGQNRMAVLAHRSCLIVRLVEVNVELIQLFRHENPRLFQGSANSFV